jgi:flagellar assembly factor FliW
MNCKDPIATELPAAPDTSGVKLPMGLLGFEQIKEFLLISNPAEEPFRWLQVKDNSALAFVVIDPFLVAPDYHPDIPQTDVEFLGLGRPQDAQLYNIVTLHSASRATVNLKGPVVINRHTGIAKQVVLANASQYSVEHPLPLTEAVTE